MASSPTRLPMPPAAAPPPTPQPAPSPQTAQVRWLYVDDKRSHEVSAGFRQEPRGEFFVQERASADPSRVVESTYPMREAWEARLHHLELESRLAMLGAYWRWDVTTNGPWTRVRSLGAATDLRPVQDKLVEGDLRFYHFHHRVTAEEAIVIEIPREAGHAMVARLDFKWPDAEAGAIRILAGDAPTPLVRSLVAREHLDLQARGHEKLVFTQDFLRAHSVGWRRDTLEAYQTLVKRLAEGRLEKPTPGEKPKVVVDSSYTDFVRALSDKRVLALHGRFLVPGEEDELIRLGDEAIKQAIAKKRHGATEQDQILLNVLEASLLARSGLRPGQRAQVDPEIAARIRRFAYYL